MSYKSWRPSSRRDRRRGNRSARSNSTSNGSDRILFVIAGVFALVILAVLVMVAFTTG